MATTVTQAQTEVLKRLANSDDGANSPELVAQIVSMIGSVQRNLCLEHAELLPRKSKAMTISAGRRYYPLPTEVPGVVAARATQGSTLAADLDYGINIADYLETTTGIPIRWGLQFTSGVISVTVTAGGTGYTNGAPVTFSAPGGSGYAAAGYLLAPAGVITGIVITDPGSDHVVAPTCTATGGTGATFTVAIGDAPMMFLSPAPADAGTLTVVYRPLPSPIVAGSDALVFDVETVIAITAAEIAAMTNSQAREALQAQASKANMLISQRATHRPAGAGSGFGLNGRR